MSVNELGSGKMMLSPRKTDNCVINPVLYVAVGRRLGHPLKLVTTRGHLFARWDDDKERFNIEATNEGLNCFPDKYYHHWPFELTELEIKSGRYLRSLTREEQLAVFADPRNVSEDGRPIVRSQGAWEKARKNMEDKWKSAGKKFADAPPAKES